jgi:hypothetical protein
VSAAFEGKRLIARHQQVYATLGGRMQTDEGLTRRCRRYIDGIRAMYVSEPLPTPPTVYPIGFVK